MNRLKVLFSLFHLYFMVFTLKKQVTIEFSGCRIELKFLVKQDSVPHYEFVSNNETFG